MNTIIKNQFIDLALLLMNSDIDITAKDVEDMLFTFANNQTEDRSIINKVTDNEEVFAEFVADICHEGLRRTKVLKSFEQFFEGIEEGYSPYSADSFDLAHQHD